MVSAVGLGVSALRGRSSAPPLSHSPAPSGSIDASDRWLVCTAMDRSDDPMMAANVMNPVVSSTPSHLKGWASATEIGEPRIDHGKKVFAERSDLAGTVGRHTHVLSGKGRFTGMVVRVRRRLRYGSPTNKGSSAASTRWIEALVSGAQSGASRGRWHRRRSSRRLGPQPSDCNIFWGAFSSTGQAWHDAFAEMYGGNEQARRSLLRR